MASPTDSTGSSNPTIAMQSSSPPDGFLPFSTLIHLLTIKLDSSNYLLWHSQIEPLLECANQMYLLDGSTSAPPTYIITDSGVSVPNPEYSSWRLADQKLRSLIQSSLTPEALATVVGCSTSRQVWLALSAAFRHESKAREISLKDELQSLRKGSQTVAEYSRTFKTLCDQLSAIGCPVPDTDKVHWYLRGLGPAFQTFYANQISQTPLSSFADLVPKANIHIASDPLLSLYRLNDKEQCTWSLNQETVHPQ